MNQLLPVGEIVGMNASLFPNKVGARDLARSMTFRQWNERSCYLEGRKSNRIITGGGENVYPSEVEDLLGSHSKIKDVAVIGVPHGTWGESVHAVIILHEGKTTTQEEILDWCRDRIAGYKRPRSVSFVREVEMPRTATGKILHRVLRERYGKQEGTRV